MAGTAQGTGKETAREPQGFPEQNRPILACHVERDERDTRHVFLHMRQVSGEGVGRNASFRFDVLGIRALAALLERGARPVQPGDAPECQALFKGGFQ